MSTRIRVSTFPRAPLAAVMGGTEHNLPCLTIADAEHDDGEVIIQLSNTPEPATWLRDAAAALLDLAEQVDASAPRLTSVTGGAL